MKGLNAFRKISLLFVSSAFFYACNTNTQVVEPSVSQEEKISMKNPVVHKEQKIYRTEINYTLDSITSKEYVDSLKNTFSEDQLKNILAINRIEDSRLSRQKKIVIPDCPSEELNAYSPFPENISVIQCIPKVALINKRVQAFGLYENGELVRWGPVSTGKSTTRTPNGLNYGNYKAIRKISSINDSWILPYYFNFMNFEGVGVHQYVLPGYPASHGCVRLYMDDAKYIYDWASMWELINRRIKKNGTPFMVFGEYDHRMEKPWFNLNNDMKANDLTAEELKILEEYMMKYQSDPKNFHNIASKITETDLAKT